jgi:hypothetical protein
VKILVQTLIKLVCNAQSILYDRRPLVIQGLCFLGAASTLMAQYVRPSSPTTTPPATISAAPSARIVAPPTGYRFPNGQSYIYRVEWHLFNAGTTTVKMDSAGAEQRVTAIGDSGGVINALYKVHDFVEARFDPRTFCSLRISKHIEEGSHRRQTELALDYTRHKSVFDDKNLKTGESRHTENDIPACVTDVLSGFYYLASLPLAPGTFNTFVVSDGTKTTDVTAHVETREHVKVPAGSYQTVRVKAEPASGPLKGKTTIVVWFSDDPSHIPVQMRSKLGWGTLMFRLQRLEK